jgi:photosystem II stability/assembly factor-like uncharacterized protein
MKLVITRRSGLAVALILALGSSLLPALPAAAIPISRGCWTVQYHPTGPNTFGELTAVSFPDSTHGWAVGIFNHILTTADGGVTWSDLGSVPNTNNLTGVSFADDLHGVAVGTTTVRLGDTSGKPTYPTIIVTSNGGVSWTKQQLLTDTGPAPTSALGFDLNSVKLVDPLHGWAAGGVHTTPGPTYGTGLLLATADGGATWADQTPSGTPFLWGLDAVDTTHAWAVGDGGAIYATGGTTTWSPKPSGSAGTLRAVDFINQNDGWTVGDGGQTGGGAGKEVEQTHDGGGSWTIVQTGFKDVVGTVGFSGVDFVNPSSGWIVGSDTVLHTTDGGSTWVEQRTPLSPQSPSQTQLSMRGVAAVDSTHAWAVGGVPATTFEPVIMGYSPTTCLPPPAAPTISSFAPGSGPPGTVITIAGSNLTTTSQVLIGGVPTSSFTVLSDTQLSATVGPSSTSGPIRVDTDGGTATSAGTFTVVTPPPTISGFTPSSGPVGTSVTITGSSFTTATTVTYNGVSDPRFFPQDDNTIISTVPVGATTGPIGVVNAGGSTASGSTFTVTTGPTPVVSSFAPTSGAAGTAVTINGANFTGVTGVAFNGASATFTFVTDIRVDTAVPAGASSGPVSVTTSNGGTGKSAATFTVTAPPPTITGFLPTSNGVGKPVIVTGTNLLGATGVSFNGTPATVFTVDGAAQITASVPVGATSGPITVTTPGGSATSSGAFTVVPAPSISGFSPSKGPVGGLVTVSGANLVGATAVTFNGVLAATYSVQNGGTLTATVPPGASSGPIAITTAGGTATSTGSFIVLQPPVITGFSPLGGPVGAPVTIDGASLADVTSVFFNGVSAVFSVVDPTRLTATVPAGATSGRISVQNPAWITSSFTQFTVIQPPVITSFSPAAAGMGMTVDIVGNNFDSGLSAPSSVAFNGSAASFNVVAPGLVRATVPVGATTGKITLTTIAGTATSSGTFTVVPTPIVTSFAPTSGVAGDRVVISGSHLTGATAVTLNGTSAVYTVDNDTQITTTAPVAVSTGLIRVTTAGGIGASASPFVVLVSPAITGFQPTSGGAGTAVTIDGANIGGASRVAFNGVNAVFRYSGLNQISAIVPAGATTGPIGITTPAGTAFSSSNFVFILAPTIASFTPVSGGAGTTIIITGTNFQGTTAVSSMVLRPSRLTAQRR